MSDNEKQREGWVSIFTSSTDYEADMVRDRLDSAGVTAAVFTQRDHALSLTVGDLARVYVMVPPEMVEDARRVLAEHLTDEELDSAAEESQPESDKPASETEEPLDSGIESIRFTTPEEPEDEKLA